MAWRLGTWSGSSFDRFNKLLGRAERLPNWKNEKSVLRSPAYGTFWSLIWQLQVAEHLCRIGTGVRWGEASGGPDLSVEIAGERWFVECYSIQKSYGLLSFLNEFLSTILEVSVQTEYRRFLPMSLPSQGEAGYLLDDILQPFCSWCYRKKARKSDVTIVCETSSSAPRVRLTSKNQYIPNTDGPGSPTHHVRVMLEESVRKKKQENQLEQHHPNILAVNLLLTDTQVASSLRPNVIQDMAPDLGDTSIDVLAVAHDVGIDKQVGAQLGVAACSSEEGRSKAMWIEGNSDALNAHPNASAASHRTEVCESATHPKPSTANGS